MSGQQISEGKINEVPLYRYTYIYMYIIIRSSTSTFWSTYLVISKIVMTTFRASTMSFVTNHSQQLNRSTQVIQTGDKLYDKNRATTFARSLRPRFTIQGKYFIGNRR